MRSFIVTRGRYTHIIIAGGWCWLKSKVIFIDPDWGDRVLAFAVVPKRKF